jgi:hypothetical protein
MTKSESNYYSKFVILVCIEPNEEVIEPAHKIILENVKLKWKKNHDPTMDPKRFSIIFVSRDDIDSIGTPENKNKFAPLNDIDNKSRIYIIGHCRKGSDDIYSNPIIRQGQPGNPAPDYFSYKDLALLITENIHMTNSSVLIPRKLQNDSQQQQSVNSLGRRLKICLTPCNTGTNKVNSNGSIEESFGKKFFDYILNRLPDRWLKCDVVATKGIVFPMPTNPNMLDLLKMLSLIRYPTTTATPGFHKRYGLVEGHMLSTLFPRHKSTNIDYKIMLIIDPLTTLEQIANRSIPISTLTGADMRARLPNQELAEFIRDDCLRLGMNEANCSLELRNRAIFIAKGILTGEMPESQVRQSYKNLIKALELENRDTPPRPNPL